MRGLLKGLASLAVSLAVAALAVAALVGCATKAPPAAKPDTTAPPRAAANAAPAATAATAASGVAPGTPQPAGPPAAGNQPLFAAVIRDARKFDGLLTLYQREEKVWIELKPEDFNKPMFLSPKLATDRKSTV